MGQLFGPAASFVARSALAGGALSVALLIAGAYAYYDSSYYTGVGRPPPQPVPFSHAHHVGGLGIDCRYCHATATTSSFAGMPTSATCMNCHKELWTQAALLEPVRESWRTGRPIAWTRVHDLPDFVQFDHSIHLAKGVGCAVCHGRVDRMPLTHKATPMTMKWCLDCHRDPGPRLRPRAALFDLAWSPPRERAAREALARRLLDEYGVLPPERLDDCSRCHR